MGGESRHTIALFFQCLPKQRLTPRYLCNIKVPFHETSDKYTCAQHKAMSRQQLLVNVLLVHTHVSTVCHTVEFYPVNR